ncbi:MULTISPECIES: ABC transporter ATP-binding protein [Rhizobium]|uniref:ABC transporter ATP-binding protein n=1 Tax=Rhizobium TaxID=379 RepID=UPI0013BE83D2|nr:MULTISPECIES: ABC transporter ATP-binding protein [Rhizobium]MBY3321516.1 ABC transporter ATP-binding protein [Rhizobium laguerreae]MBY3362770.1 ABC transporter ATP-binding protein [Rhizobium laguerreae]MCA2436671.1 ABC transporter ATP-binding protein [Rhizobium leguminosarum]NEH73485.1 ATP-binding cassette domain-containing protein [Rhizobium leguminosarum]NKM67651.1 ATP-binding cassette domain-containing protein [Rhizobium laguerreae]
MLKPLALQNAREVALQVRNIRLRYGGFDALKGVSLTVQRGEFVALLGPSGCGKTSLLRTIAGFVTPQEGNVVLNGHDVAGLEPRYRNIGIVFQSYALFPHMTARENVRFGLDCRNLPTSTKIAMTDDALELVGLGHLGDRKPKQLSGGQQQRVALARAIVFQPDLLLLDEPLGALDKQLRVQMQTELKALQRRLGVTAVFVTHDQEEAMSMADRIVVMRDGDIVQLDSPEELFAKPQSAWVCQFVGSGNLLRGDFKSSKQDEVELSLGGGNVLRAPGSLSENIAIQIPFGKVRVEHGGDGGLKVIGKRFLGAALELQIETPAGLLCAHLEPNFGAEFEVGSSVNIAADTHDCRVVPA